MAKKRNFTQIEQTAIINTYKDGKSLNDVGVKFGVTIAAVSYILEKNNVKRRTIAEGNALKWESDEFKNNQINKRTGKPSGALGKKWTIPYRVFHPNNTGSNNPRWKGGKTKLSASIRTLPEYSIWRTNIFKRDNYTCVKCGRKRKKGDRVIIDADHIHPFSKLLDEYNIKRVYEAISCEALWDIENGRTLCRECHKDTETWGINQYTK